MYTRRRRPSENKKEPLLKKKDIILIADCLLLAAMSIFVRRVTKQSQEGGSLQVVVYRGDEEYARYPLDGEYTEELQGRGGGTNLLEIRGGKADVASASCPDKICVRQTPVSEVGETIVCLPNQVVVAVEAAD